MSGMRRRPGRGTDVAGNSGSGGLATLRPGGDDGKRGGGSSGAASVARYCIFLVVVLLVAGGGLFAMSMRPSYMPSWDGLLKEDQAAGGGKLSSPLTPKTTISRPDRGIEVKVARSEENDEETGFFHVSEEVKLYYRAVGHGPRAVLLVHGGPGTPPGPEGWGGIEHLASEAGDDYTFYYIHQRGCGLSTRPITTSLEDMSYYAAQQELLRWLSLREQVADIERVRRLLHEDHIAVVGHSFGGFIASCYAAEFPNSVASLVLEAPANMLRFPKPVFGYDMFASIRELLPAGRRHAFDDFHSEYTDYGHIFSHTDAELAMTNFKFLAFYREAMIAAGSPLPPHVAEMDVAVDAAPPEIGGWLGPGIFFSMGMWGFDMTPALQRVGHRVHTLVLHGREDLQPQELSQDFATQLHGRFQIVAGCGHFIHDEHPAAFAHTLGAFLKE